MGNVELPNREANFRALKVHSTLRRAACPLTRRSRRVFARVGLLRPEKPRGGRRPHPTLDRARRAPLKGAGAWPKLLAESSGGTVPKHVGQVCWHSKAKAATRSAFQTVPAVRAAGSALPFLESGGEDALNESQRFDAWRWWPSARTTDSSLAEISCDARMLLQRACV